MISRVRSPRRGYPPLGGPLTRFPPRPSVPRTRRGAHREICCHPTDFLPRNRCRVVLSGRSVRRRPWPIGWPTRGLRGWIFPRCGGAVVGGAAGGGGGGGGGGGAGGAGGGAGRGGGGGAAGEGGRGGGVF